MVLSAGKKTIGALRLFGTLSLEVPGAVLDEEQLAPGAASLLKLLGLTSGHALARERIVEALWPDKDAESGSNRLYKTVHQLRAALPDDAAVRRLIAAQRNVVHLADWIVVDVDRFEAAARVALADPSPEGFERALDLYRADALPGAMYEEWAHSARERWQLLAEQLRLELSELYIGAGKFARAESTLRAVLQTSPTCERAHRLLMTVYLERDDRGMGLLQYRACAAALMSEFDIAPSDATQAVYRALLDPSRPAAVLA